MPTASAGGRSSPTTCCCSPRLRAPQFLVQTAPQLLALRLVIGVLLGTDYVVSKALLTEFTPRAFRGRIMSTLSVAWAGGYTCAYFVGYALADAGIDAWRWMLVASAVPCLLILPLRLTLPESPLWLVTHGRAVAAAAVVRRWIGPDVSPPNAPPVVPTIAGRWAQLVSPRWRRRTIVACTFFTCQVIPYFAVGTFVTRVLEALEVGDSFVGGLVYNLSLLFGSGPRPAGRRPHAATHFPGRQLRHHRGSDVRTAGARRSRRRLTIIVLFAVFAVRAVRGVEPLLRLPAGTVPHRPARFGHRPRDRGEPRRIGGQYVSAARRREPLRRAHGPRGMRRGTCVWRVGLPPLGTRNPSLQTRYGGMTPHEHAKNNHPAEPAAARC